MNVVPAGSSPALSKDTSPSINGFMRDVVNHRQEFGLSLTLTIYFAGGGLE